jgi:hypothetical protein
MNPSRYLLEGDPALHPYMKPFGIATSISQIMHSNLDVAVNDPGLISAKSINFNEIKEVLATPKNEGLSEKSLSIISGAIKRLKILSSNSSKKHNEVYNATAYFEIPDFQILKDIFSRIEILNYSIGGDKISQWTIFQGFMLHNFIH